MNQVAEVTEATHERVAFSFVAPVGQPVDLQVAAIAGLSALEPTNRHVEGGYQSPGGAFILTPLSSRAGGMREWLVGVPARSPAEVRWAVERISALGDVRYVAVITNESRLDWAFGPTDRIDVRETAVESAVPALIEQLMRLRCARLERALTKQHAECAAAERRAEKKVDEMERRLSRQVEQSGDLMTGVLNAIDRVWMPRRSREKFAEEAQRLLS